MSCLSEVIGTVGDCRLDVVKIYDTLVCRVGIAVIFAQRADEGEVRYVLVESGEIGDFGGGLVFDRQRPLVAGRELLLVGRGQRRGDRVGRADLLDGDRAGLEVGSGDIAFAVVDHAVGFHGVERRQALVGGVPVVAGRQGDRRIGIAYRHLVEVDAHGTACAGGGVDAPGFGGFAVGEHQEEFTDVAALGGIVSACCLPVEHDRAFDGLVGGHLDRLDVGVYRFVRRGDGDDIGRAGFQLPDLRCICRYGQVGAVAENLLGRRNRRVVGFLDADVCGFLRVGQFEMEREGRFGRSACDDRDDGRPGDGLHFEGFDLRIDAGVGDCRRDEVDGGGFQVLDEELTRLGDGGAVAENLFGRGNGRPFGLFETDVCGRFGVGQGRGERKGRRSGRAGRQNDGRVYVGGGGGVFDGFDLAVDLAVGGDCREAVGGAGFEVADRDETRCGYGFAVGENFLGRGNGFGGFGADIGALVRVAQGERKFQRVGCGVTDSQRDGRSRRIPPPSSLSSHEARRPEHSTSSAVLHERIDLIIDVIFGISN